MGFNKKISSDEARRCPQCAQPTCNNGCPLGIDIPGFIRLLRESDAAAALERIKNENPFPAICGRICPAPCEDTCVFNDEGAPIAIRALERYASDHGSKSARTKLTPSLNGKKVAIVGSGPSAMMAAYVLLKERFQVVMFEAASEPGGVLRFGIPEYRLPREILNEQFELLASLGLELHTDVFIGRTKPLQELIKGFDAVLLAVGASLPNFSSIKGENLAGVYYAEEFLYRLQMISKQDVSGAVNLLRGQQMVVLGKGFAALDAARLGLRLGQKVDLVFQGLEEEMGVAHDDLKEAVEEGLTIHAPYETLCIEGDAKDFVQGLRIRRLEIAENKGSLSLVPVQEESEVLPAQTIVLANGQKSNSFLAKSTDQLKVKDDGTLWVEHQGYLTSLPKVFAVGSVLDETLSVVDAFAHGKAAARQILEYLK